MISQTKSGRCKTRLQKEGIKQEIYGIKPVGAEKQPLCGGHGTQPVFCAYAYPVFAGRVHMECGCPIPSGFALKDRLIFRIKHNNLEIFCAWGQTPHCNIPSFVIHKYTSRSLACVTQYQHMRIYYGCERRKRSLPLRKSRVPIAAECVGPRVFMQGQLRPRRVGLGTDVQRGLGEPPA